MLGERDPDPHGRELLVPELEPEAECDSGENAVSCVRAVPVWHGGLYRIPKKAGQLDRSAE